MEKKHKILVVEDDMIIQMFLSHIISNQGFDVVGEARSCEQVISLVKKHQPDLILMDIGISGSKDGIETAQILNKSNKIPIIFITGNSDESTIDRAKKEDPLDFIFKPIDEERLVARLIEFRKNHP